MTDMDPGDCTTYDQLALTNLYPCPNTACRAGRTADPETDETVKCRVCLGSGTVAFDPEDFSQVPY